MLAQRPAQEQAGGYVCKTGLALSTLRRNYAHGGWTEGYEPLLSYLAVVL
jgi:hypothetical protein